MGCSLFHCTVPQREYRKDFCCAVNPAVDPVMPPFKVVLCTHQKHKHRHILDREGGIADPLSLNIHHQGIQLVVGCVSVEVVECFLDMFRWQAGQSNDLSDE